VMKEGTKTQKNRCQKKLDALR